MRSSSFSLCLCAAVLIATGCHRQQPPAQQGGGGAPAVNRSTPAVRQQAAAVNLACKLLTKDDAEALLGGPVLDPPVTSTMADIGVVSWRCGYISEAKNPTSKVVTLLDNHWQQATDARSAFERAHVISQTISGQAPENVEGLGERAYWAGGKVNQLNVLAGADWLVIGGTLGPGLDQLAPARAAAAKILAHHQDQ